MIRGDMGGDDGKRSGADGLRLLRDGGKAQLPKRLLLAGESERAVDLRTEQRVMRNKQKENELNDDRTVQFKLKYNQ
jgi:hypothetical protein